MNGQTGRETRVRRVLVVDNYDSFTYNLVQSLRTLSADVVVRRNDALDARDAVRMAPTHLVVSPGPGRPEDAGNSMSIIQALMSRACVLGVCLGHQALAAVMGGRIGPAQRLLHGKSSPIYHDSRTLFQGLPNPFPAGRYHSLAVEETGLPTELTITAYTSAGEIMAVRHRSLPVEGVQFHPESHLTPEGDRLLRNFLDLEPAGESS